MTLNLIMKMKQPINLDDTYLHVRPLSIGEIQDKSPKRCSVELQSVTSRSKIS